MNNRNGFYTCKGHRQNRIRRGAAAILSIVFALSVLLVPAAGKEVQAADLTLADAQAMVADAQAKLNEVRAQQARGAYGFFEWVIDTYPEQAEDASSAIEALDAYKNVAPGIDPAVEGDATQLASMVRCMELLKECNELRASDNNFPGLQPYAVTHTLMAMAMSNADMSTQEERHLMHFNVGENLAWGYSDPYTGWYHKEKKIYDERQDGVIGHYIAVVSKHYVATGLGRNSRPGSIYGGPVHSQVFEYEVSTPPISVEDYTMELQQYMASIDPAPYEEALKAAEFLRDSLTPVAMYRLYYPPTHEHFYTADANEKRVLSTERGWDYEGIGWYAPKAGTTPVYRLYNPFTTDHHYTKDYNEYKHLGTVGWQQEGIGWYSADPKNGVPLYRLFTKALTVGAHHYTKDMNERTQLIKSGVWMDEDIGWYGMRGVE